MVPSTKEIEMLSFGFREPHMVRLKDDVVFQGSPFEWVRQDVTSEQAWQ
jgi:hypothetical protein